MRAPSLRDCFESYAPIVVVTFFFLLPFLAYVDVDVDVDDDQSEAFRLWERKYPLSSWPRIDHI